MDYLDEINRREQRTEDNNKLCEALMNYHAQNLKRYVQLSLFPNPEVKTGKEDIRVVELFAGVGGFRVGLERSSKLFKTVWNNQWEPSTKKQDASMVYQRRFGIEGHSNLDINTVATDDIPECDLLVGGFPCQDYSVATTLKNSGGIMGKKGVLWWEIYRILNECNHKPDILFLENVDRLLKSPAKQRGRDFAIILASLSDLGYAVEWRVINAADYGMPQRRRRTYIVGYHKNCNIFEEMIAKDLSSANDWLLKYGIIAKAFPVNEEVSKLREFGIEGDLMMVSDKFNTGEDAISAGPFLNTGIIVNRMVTTLETVPEYDGMRVNLGDILIDEDEVADEFFIKDEDLPKWKYQKGGKKEKRMSSEGYEYTYSEGPMAFPDYLDRPSRTIITGEGGNSPSRFKHVVLTPSGRYRRLTPVELERLNMFPDNHTFAAGVTDSRRAFLMGNALVTGIVEGIGRELAIRYEKKHDG